MSAFDNISQRLTDMIRSETPMDDTKAEQIEYGIYMVISELFKLTLIFVAALILNIGQYAITGIVLFGIYRAFLGGIHAKTQVGCFVLYVAIFFPMIYLSMHLSVNQHALSAIVYPLCMLIVYKYAPADVENKPIVSKKQRRYLRIGGFISLTVIMMIAQFLHKPYTYILILTSAVNGILMLPLVYKLTGNQYSRKEV